MTDPSQLESDHALAMRLQEEEFANNRGNPAALLRQVRQQIRQPENPMSIDNNASMRTSSANYRNNDNSSRRNSYGPTGGFRSEDPSIPGFEYPQPIDSRPRDLRRSSDRENSSIDPFNELIAQVQQSIGGPRLMSPNMPNLFSGPLGGDQNSSNRRDPHRNSSSQPSQQRNDRRSGDIHYPQPPQQRQSSQRNQREQRSAAQGQRPGGTILNTRNSILDAFAPLLGSVVNSAPPADEDIRSRSSSFQVGPGVVHIQTHFGSPDNAHPEGSGPDGTWPDPHGFSSSDGRNQSRSNRSGGRNRANRDAQRDGGANNIAPLHNLLSMVMLNLDIGDMQGNMGAMDMGDFQNFVSGILPDFQEHESYEDMVNLIERMGGNVNRSATDSEINNLPTHTYSKADSIKPSASMSWHPSAAGPSSTGAQQNADNNNEADDKCAICLAVYEDGNVLRTLPCSHMFHSECIDLWLKVNRTCPFCKASIRPSDGDSD